MRTEILAVGGDCCGRQTSVVAIVAKLTLPMLLEVSVCSLSFGEEPHCGEEISGLFPAVGSSRE